MIDENILCSLIFPLSLEIAYKVVGIPCPTFRLKMYFVKTITSRIPMAGYAKYK
jgi:hypothetical protein